ncbi:MAG: M3 family metallopeptidase [Burkholderiales bacterium]|jgi:oligopeptidase A|nr:M3 family metallopeptidase [Burkholderiales bacterium]
MDNPLLVSHGLPLFAEIQPQHVALALAQRLEEARAVVEKAVAESVPPNWDNLVAPITDALDRLEQMWGAVSHLNAVVSSSELRDAYNKGLPLLTAFHSELTQDSRLYRRYQILRDGEIYTSLPEAQRVAIDKTLRDFRLGGVALPQPQRDRFKAIQKEKANISATFSDHLLDATQDHSLLVTNARELAGLPEDVIAKARALAEKSGERGWRLTLLAPCYRPVMQYAEHRPLRAALHRAYATRASELGVNPQRDNTVLIDRLLTLREEEARLLGFSNFGDLSLVPKMANGTEEVITFLRDLARQARPFAQRDYEELSAFAKAELDISELQPWDIMFASEKLKQRNYAFSDRDIRVYFPENKVLSGLFGLIENLYSITVHETPTSSWHPDVRYFELYEKENSRRIGSFYLDLYAREKKQGGAWMSGALPLRVHKDGRQNPVVYLTCNFSSPNRDKPAMFTHDDVLTLFHEFGHGLHHLLTREATPGVSGMEGFEWDAVELPSQLMENFCWEWSIVEAMSAHVDTGAPLPRALFDRMLAARNFQSGMFLLRQIEFALFDMAIHIAVPQPDVRAALQAIRREIAVVPYADYDRFPNSFGHIFAGGYAAGYYSYLWAEILSSDVYSFFEETDQPLHVVGRKLRDEILSRGSVRSAQQSFIAFRGRPPKIDAFLRHNGLLDIK